MRVVAALLWVLLAAVPAFAQSWTVVPNSQPLRALPSNLPSDIWGWSDPEGITSAWNSGCFDAARNRMYIYGGGHADGAYNGVLAFDLASQTWSRLTEPSLAYPKLVDSTTSADQYTDGTPASVHTYGVVQCLPDPIDAVFIAGGSRWYDGRGSNTAWLLDLKSRSWRRAGSFPGPLGLTSAYDSQTRKVIVRNEASNYFSYDPASGSRTTPWTDDAVGNYENVTSILHAGRRSMLTIGNWIASRSGADLGLLLNVDQTGSGQLVRFTGATEILSAMAPGLTYDWDRQLIVAWAGGPSVYEIDIARQVITRVTGGGSPPGDQESNGTFNRFAYVGGGRFALVNKMTDPVYFFQANGSSPAPSPSPAPPPPAPTPAPPPPPPPPPPAPPASVPPPAPTPTPPTSSTSIPDRTWVARPLVGTAPGMYYSSWFTSGKHGRITFNSSDGRLWFAGGDWYSWNDPTEDGNGNNELWSYGVATNTWRKEYPPGNTPCAPSGDIVPAQPDESTWVYDARRNLFYLAPGFWFGIQTYRTHCQAATPIHSGLVFDPVSRKYSQPPFAAPPGGWGGDLIAKSGVYDPQTDSLIRFANRGSMSAEQLNLTTNTWTVTPIGVGDAYVEQDPMAIDVQGRQLYGIDYSGKRLIRWGIDSRQSKSWPLPSNYAWNCGDPASDPAECFDSNNGLMTFDTINRALFIPNMPSKLGLIKNVYVFWVDQERWEELPLVQPGGGATVNGNTMQYDPVNNVHVLIGGRITPHFFLFRLGGGSGSAPPPPSSTPPPTPQFTVTLVTGGTGTGTARGAGTYGQGSTVTLTATPAAGSRFDGWTGDADCLDGVLNMTGNRRCVATFTLQASTPPPPPSAPTQFTVTLVKAGTGGGTVSGAGSYAANSAVSLGATPAAGSRFDGWTGDSDCLDGQLLMTDNRRCVATFTVVATPAPAPTPTPTAGRSRSANPSNYLSVLPTLVPGDTLTLASGSYPGLPVANLNGTPTSPITITGPSSGAPALIVGSAGVNTVRIRGSSYVVLRNLEVDARNLGGDGVNGETTSHHVTLDGLYIHGCSDDQQTVGISTNRAPVWNWVIRNTVVTDCGTGMYLGNSGGTEPFIAGLLEYNLVYDTIGYNVQIKEQLALPTDVAGLPLARTKTILRHNVFSKGNRASTGDMARPNVLIGHVSLAGAGQDNGYEIYGNFFYLNPTGEPLFQGEGNLAVYDNLFYNSVDPSGASAAILIQPHNDRPRDVRVFNNTVVSRQRGISVSGGYSTFQQKVIANAVFSATPISATDQANNATGTFSGASTALTNPFGALGQLDLYPKVGQLTGAPPDTSSYNSFTDWNKDFNGATRVDFGFRGAYGTAGVNPGWLPKLERKPLIVSTPTSPTPASPTPPPSPAPLLVPEPSTPPPAPTPAQFTVTLTRTGTGTGTMQGAGTYATGTTVTLSAASASGSEFVGWSGDSGCAGGTLTMTANRRCVATFNLVVAPDPSDRQPPTIRFIGDGSIFGDRVVYIRVTDGASSLAQVKVFVNGTLTKTTKSRSTHLTIHQSVPWAGATVRVEATDAAGNSVVRQTTLSARTPTTIPASGTLH